MKLAVLTLVYNEEEFIKACVKNWEGKVDKHLILISTMPWSGVPFESDESVQIAKRLNVETILGAWKSEGEQRNWGLARLYDYDYVIIVDPDEFYTKESQDKILDRLNDPYDYVNMVMEKIPVFKIEKMITYWKTTDFILNPPDLHLPCIALDPKQAVFHSMRNPQLADRVRTFAEYQPIIGGTVCHHLSWVKSDKKIEEKIVSYSHSNVIPSDWFENVWSKWEEGSDMIVRPYGAERGKAIKSPAPDEIKQLFF